MSTCGGPVLDALRSWPVGCASSRSDLGTTALHKELEGIVANFVGKEAAIVFNMGCAWRAAPPRRAARSRASRRVSKPRARARPPPRRDQLDDDPGARLEGLAHHLGRAQPHEHRERRARERRAHPHVCAQRPVRPRAHPARGDRDRAPAHAAAVDEDPRDGRGHLLDGGRDLQPEGDLGRVQEVSARRRARRAPSRGSRAEKHRRPLPPLLAGTRRTSTSTRRTRSARSARPAAARASTAASTPPTSTSSWARSPRASAAWAGTSPARRRRSRTCGARARASGSRTR